MSHGIPDGAPSPLPVGHLLGAPHPSALLPMPPLLGLPSGSPPRVLVCALAFLDVCLEELGVLSVHATVFAHSWWETSGRCVLWMGPLWGQGFSPVRLDSSPCGVLAGPPVSFTEAELWVPSLGSPGSGRVLLKACRRPLPPSPVPTCRVLGLSFLGSPQRTGGFQPVPLFSLPGTLDTSFPVLSPLLLFVLGCKAQVFLSF